MHAGMWVYGNLAHEFGIFEKQSSFFTQGVAGMNTIEGNIAYNGCVIKAMIFGYHSEP